MVNGTSFESSIKTYQRARDYRASYRDLCQYNLGSSKWDKIVKNYNTYIIYILLDGKNHRFVPWYHINNKREDNNEIQRASGFVHYDLTDEHNRLGRLIKSITYK